MENSTYICEMYLLHKLCVMLTLWSPLLLSQYTEASRRNVGNLRGKLLVAFNHFLRNEVNHTYINLCQYLFNKVALKVSLKK